ncbi:uncharacterized protein Z518_03932 [Rhinocladiella mackenziei CBS 650.93]|uniref:Rhinocladiella mackenziei CBS 650.93 unplaced genomic scaffold supercont1.3, whole genome shotgun sequence n=1 Tax=Rhinocladiella mackenziei CBS 650.93 TaxID=1442369 RepID=A0A0D2H6E8_9EURO|nr:uncharacterized protein Z518_03932 [Rhinocladiella mackenziei CBS 650.93]KIX05958.1 hypothetical protein Z518_03932 [Rhinocladiella mackenziei CBS 650.93]
MATQVLPTPSSQFPPTQMSYGNEMLNTYSSFDNVAAGNTPYNSNPNHQSLLMLSPPAVSSDIQYRRQSSHSPQAGLGALAIRDRTPIRHHRPSVSRGRSHSRSEMLLAYAAEQNQLHQSQSLPSIAAMPSQSESTMPQVYNMPAYNMSPPISSFPQQGSYFGTPVPPSTGHQESEFPLPSNETEIPAFYPVGRTSSHGSAISLPPPDSPHSLYIPGHAQHSQQPLPSIGMAMQPFPPAQLTLESSPAEVEIIPSRPKPQCWDHGCNGRQFSTFSNLLRHQREKSGSAMKAVCPHCGTEFTRTTARNGHMSGGKCKGRADAEASNRMKKE